MNGRGGILVVGAGPAGLACGIALLRASAGEVTILEALRSPGGIAGGFEKEGLSFDYGSHRIHPSAGPEILSFLAGLPGLSLRRRRRNGRILLRGRLVRFPPTPTDALFRLPPALSAGILTDQAAGLLGAGGRSAGNFAEAVERGMGRTMAGAFYLPYTRKLWGLEASEISPVQARRRVSASGRGGLLRKVLSGLPLLSLMDPSRYFRYPERGFASLAAAMALEFEHLGGRLITGCEVTGLDAGPSGVSVTAGGASLQGRHLFWSAPLDALGRAAACAPPEVREAARSLRSRAMVLLYAVFDGGPFTRFDAHYFPGPETRFSRMSEPRNYPCEPVRGRSGLCLELPCDVGDASWAMAPEELLLAARSELGNHGPGFPAQVESAWVHRLTHAYPVYRIGYERDLESVSRWAACTGAVTLIGRQGLFAHDNLHHAMETGLGAASCLAGSWDGERWGGLLEGFRSHCVSD